MNSELTARLRETVESGSSRLMSISDAEAARRPGPGKWSKKEILGHLIDSAANNHQRFIRAQQVDELIFPGYEQEAWVGLQDPNSRSWTELVDLWRLYNLHLAHVLARVPTSKQEVQCRIGASEPVTLAFLMEDYLRHLQHHLSQL
jgi:hypothetical protein